MLFFTSFHLNLMYSSIEVEQRPTVIERCYWPLLRLAEECDVPLGIEASAVTLEIVAALDPEWIACFRRLVHQNRCELIGSGYAQLIGPLVPAGVNVANLRIGNAVYEQLMGARPGVALVNEQAYASGLIGNYLDAGYEAIIMDWNNPARQHHEWQRQWRYYPQRAVDGHGRQIPVIWNNSITFQKFQRYAHGEMEIGEFVDYLANTGVDSEHVVPLYGNDVEIFDFRPGRYHTEAALHQDGEWQRIFRLVQVLKGDKRFSFVLPGQVCALMDEPDAGHPLCLESAEEPIPVKKQDKYNVTRWGVTGRDDLGINSACWRIYHALCADGGASEEEWRELCYLWSSDFRTHITPKRWSDFLTRLDLAGRRHCKREAGSGEVPFTKIIPPCVRLEETDRFITIETPLISVRLNHMRGLAIDGLCFKEVGPEPLCSTLPHGYYDDITFGADYYTGHLVFEIPGQPKVTDLCPVEYEIMGGESGALSVSGTIATQLGPVHKQITVTGHSLVISYRLEWDAWPVGALRLGAITLNPAAFDRASLRFCTHNGGCDMEEFTLAGKDVQHGAAASFLVSAKQSLGVTEGVVEISDAKKVLVIQVDKDSAALLAQITYRELDSTYFSRCSFSAQEMDETSRSAEYPKHVNCTITVSARMKE